MREYSGTLLFENVLDDIVTGNTYVDNLINRILAPSVRIKEADCGTALGEVITLDYSAQGLIELATGLPLTHARITSLLSSGIYKVSVRTLHTCQTVDGVCLSCYNSSLPNAPEQDVGDVVTVRNQFVLLEETLVLKAGTHTYPLAYDKSVYEYDFIVVSTDNSTLSYSLSDTSITLTGTVVDNETLSLKYVVYSNRPLMAMLSATFSGSLLGMRSLREYKTTLNPRILRNSITAQEVDGLYAVTSGLGTVPSNMLRYSTSITDNLEKALFLLTMFILHSSMN